MPFPRADGWPQDSSWECPSSASEKRDHFCAGFEEEVWGVFHCLSEVLRELKQSNANKNGTRMTAGARSRAAQLECCYLSQMSWQKSLRKGSTLANLEKELEKIHTGKKTDLGLCGFLFSYITKCYKIVRISLFQKKNVEPWWCQQHILVPAPTTCCTLGGGGLSRKLHFC